MQYVVALKPTTDLGSTPAGGGLKMLGKGEFLILIARLKLLAVSAFRGAHHAHIAEPSNRLPVLQHERHI